MGWFSKTFWTLASLGLVYIAALLSLTIPVVQRNATYAHNLNPTIWQNISDVEAFGFLKGQVQPFVVSTPDGCSIYAWHIMPINVYKQHEEQLKSHASSESLPYHRAAQQPGLQALFNDPNAIVLVSFHGNAGHLAYAYRSPMYQNLLSLSTPARPIHVIAFDYRGFGLSTCTPSEEGVALDAVTLLSHLTGHDMSPSINDKTNSAFQSLRSTNASVDPTQIVLIGQSLGTFVSTATYHAWTAQLQRPALRSLMLVASFTSLPKLLDSYSIKGFTPPLLSPVMHYPALQKWFLSKVIDKWDTRSRLVSLFRDPAIPLDLTIMHSRDDWEIPWQEGYANFQAVSEAVGVKDVYDRVAEEGSGGIEYQEWDMGEGVGRRRKRARWERVNRGGHNRVTVGEQMKVAVLRVLDGD